MRFYDCELIVYYCLYLYLYIDLGVLDGVCGECH